MDAPTAALPRRLLTDRLQLQAVTAADAARIHEGVVDALDALRAWPRSLPWAMQPPSLAASAAFCAACEAGWQRGDDFAMLILRRDDGAHLGNVGLHRPLPAAGAIEVGYWCRPAAQGHGYVAEAVRALSDAALAAGFRRILCLCEAGNHRSRAVAERAGFVLRGIETVGPADADPANGPPPYERCRYVRERAAGA